MFSLHPCYSKNPSRSGQRIATGLIAGIVSLICYGLSESIKKERLQLKQKSKEIRTKERNEIKNEIKINKKKESIKSKYNKLDIINDIKLHHKLLKNRYTSRNIGQIRVYLEEYHPNSGKYKENYYIILYVPELYSNYMVFNNKFEVFTYLDRLYQMR